MALSAPILSVKQIAAGSQGEIWATIEGRRMCVMHAKNIEASVSYDKEQVSILGKRGKGNRKTGETYSGSMTLYMIESAFRELAQRYKNTGEDFYFDLQIKQSDETTDTGTQLVTLKDVNFDSLIIAKLDADSSILEEDIDFTFEDWRLEESYTEIPGLFE